MTVDQALSLAQDSSTDAATLERVAQVLRPGLKDGTALALAIAANPNTHPETLIALLTDRPSGSHGLAQNPATALFLLDDPLFFEKVPSPVLRRTLNLPDLPRWLVEHLAGHNDATVALAARLHRVVRPEVKMGWEVEAARLIGTLPLADLSGYPGGDWPHVCTAWSEGYAPQSVGERLASSHLRPLRESIFGNETRGRLTSFYELLQRATGSPTLERIQPKFAHDLTEAELIRLARGGVWARQLAARHPAASPELLAILAGDNEEVRKKVLKNPATPDSIRTALAEPTSHGYAVVRKLELPPLPRDDHPLYSVLLSVRFNIDSAPVFLSRFFGGASRQREASSVTWQVRFASACLDSLPEKTLERLAGDANRLVQAAAKNRLQDPDWRFRFAAILESRNP
ncbi:hypothetical protein [Armatimonas rosea]|uniref:Leucine rich repeat variant n=1 Tax=Armatimonas rosea TaxID=685828 RepID=A0A7W9SU96_ARMRO|nr:hypothetical protein [Armatimonas rosea]MBB6052344.1 hypothetical protein [Armatimonas rosea]